MKAIGCEGVSVNDLNELYKAMLLNANHQDKQTTVNIANYIAVNKNFKLNKDFFQQVSDGYQAGIESLDFTSSKSTDRINGWCKEKTNGMIPRIIDQVSADAVSYLMNAIYSREHGRTSSMPRTLSWRTSVAIHVISRKWK